MVPLSTRDEKERDGLAVLTSAGTSMIPGVLVTVIMPILVKKLGVGDGARINWLAFMSFLSCIALPASLLEYYFTLERVTASSSHRETSSKISFRTQLMACLHDRCWVLITVFLFILHIVNGLSHSSMLYYCNWVLSSSVSDGASKQIIINMIGQAPLGFGVFILWPLVRRLTVIGFFMAAIGSGIVMLAGQSLLPVLIGLFIRSFGSLPTYLSGSYLAEALEHVERSSGYRVDGLSASISSISSTTAAGAAQTALLGGMHLAGYITPVFANQVILQPLAIRTWFSWCFAGFSMIGFMICSVIICFYSAD